MHKDIKISCDLCTKPQPIVFYNYTKGGVDIVDLLSSSLSTRIKSKRLVFLLDTVRTNSRTIYLERKDTNISNFQYNWILGKSLVLPHMQRRFKNPVGLQASVLQKMTRVLGIYVAQQPLCLKECHRENTKKRKIS